MWNAWIVGVLGIWMVVAPFVGMAAVGNAWNDWIVGVLVAVLGFAIGGTHRGQAALAGVFGVWLFIAGFIPSLRLGSGLYWNDIIVGIVVLIAGFAATRPMVVARPPA